MTRRCTVKDMLHVAHRRRSGAMLMSLSQFTCSAFTYSTTPRLIIHLMLFCRVWVAVFQIPLQHENVSYRPKVIKTHRQTGFKQQINSILSHQAGMHVRQRLRRQRSDTCQHLNVTLYLAFMFYTGSKVSGDT